MCEMEGYCCLYWDISLIHSHIYTPQSTQAFADALSEAVRIRVQNIADAHTHAIQADTHTHTDMHSTQADVAVLFSGGIDCTVLAVLAHTHARPHAAIDLVNVCFVGEMDASVGYSKSPGKAECMCVCMCVCVCSVYICCVSLYDSLHRPHCERARAR
jgi:asparagine synthetase B (glutamine-hydrolysing)